MGEALCIAPAQDALRLPCHCGKAAATNHSAMAAQQCGAGYPTIAIRAVIFTIAVRLIRYLITRLIEQWGLQRVSTGLQIGCLRRVWDGLSHIPCRGHPCSAAHLCVRYKRCNARYCVFPSHPRSNNYSVLYTSHSFKQRLTHALYTLLLFTNTF